MGDIVVDPKALYEKNKGAERIRGVFTTGTKVGGKGLFGQNVFIGPFPEFMPDGYEGWRKVRFDYIHKFPEWTADPVPQARFRGKNKDEEERQPWRRSHSMDYDNPQKSVALNLRNLRDRLPLRGGARFFWKGEYTGPVV
uniref:Uncharacterized protein n=1 Tax=Chromera velia CCMP2878 TaxID=1169474 RepID=A0A0G4HH08_9ALVE|eukprot:Cvel_27502.t1-p1 / transcript=Cvel_27502.t1 / gene=Cvel_27502 / organism=Chromera_velia_CCMP2878 / gene_product=hypothetical protein / transcript_product=hypothetical protein / location=Cvel_scaffold3441:6501-9375(+) / protein_length=139 / sequence_SO=supercontig / SO=protein_coding / is_pseudo=false